MPNHQKFPGMLVFRLKTLFSQSRSRQPQSIPPSPPSPPSLTHILPEVLAATTTSYSHHHVSMTQLHSSTTNLERNARQATKTHRHTGLCRVLLGDSLSSDVQRLLCAQESFLEGSRDQIGYQIEPRLAA